MKKTAALAFRVTDDLKDALRDLAEADNRSLSSYIELILKKHVDQKVKRK